MFWLTVGKILWARRLIIAIVSLGALAGGAFVVATADRQYDATARVMLTLYKPDAITGATVGRKQIDPYLQSQLDFIRDIQVVLPAVEAVGWMDDPEILATYSARPAGDDREFPIWLAQSVAVALETTLVEDSNIIEIRYRGSSPELAALVAGAVRDAYIAGSIRERRMSAAADAESRSARVARLRKELDDLQVRRWALEQQTGVILNRTGADLDSERLAALASPPQLGARAAIIATPATLRGRLAQVDMEIAMAEQTLGRNHPRLVQMRQMRTELAARADAEDRDAGGVAGAVIASERAKAAAYESQRQRVLDQRQDALRVRVLRDQILLKAQALDQAQKQIAYLRQLTTATESGLVPIGDVKNVPGIAYPSIPLILGGTGGLGLLGGIIAAMLVEVLNLRVRTLTGLRIAAAPLPVLGAIPALRDEAAKAPRRRFRLTKLKPATT